MAIYKFKITYMALLFLLDNTALDLPVLHKVKGRKEQIK